MWRNADYVEKVGGSVDRIGRICERCKLRFCGNKSSVHHAKVEANPKLTAQTTEDGAVTKDENGGADNSPPPAKLQKLDEELCLACCGVLQESYMSSVLNRVSQDIKESDYQSDHFMVAISLPVSLMLRDHALKILLDEMTEGEFDDDEVPAVKQVWKWVFSPRLAKQIGGGMNLVSGDNCEFYVELQLDAGTDSTDLECLDKMSKGAYTKRAQHEKKKYTSGSMTRQAVEKSLSEVTAATFKRNYPVPPSMHQTQLSFTVKMYHNSFYIAGRYNKFSRVLPQTPWLLDGKRVMESSVEEMIAEPLKKLIKIDGIKFGSSGREDVDVRMLGEGRPFLLEIVNSRRVKYSPEEMRSFQNSINKQTKDVFVRDLQIVPKSDTKVLKEGEDNKQKVYQALCVVTLGENDNRAELMSRIVDLSKTPSTELAQKTPIRVLHRRANAERTRNIYWMKFQGEIFPDHRELKDGKEESRILFKLDVCTQAGTYVKEFVHGDFGRTHPSLSTILGCDNVDILALDVKSIVMDWPPKIKE